MRISRPIITICSKIFAKSCVRPEGKYPVIPDGAYLKSRVYKIQGVQDTGVQDTGVQDTGRLKVSH